MGQQHSTKLFKNFSDEQIEKQTETMFNNTNQRFSIQDVSMTISLVLQNLKTKIPIQKIPSGIVMNRHMIKIMYHNQYVSTITKLITLLVEKLQEMGDRNILLIKRHQWGILSQLVKFILIFTDQKLIQTVQLYTIRLSQLDHNIKTMIEEQQLSKGSFTAVEKKIIDKLSPHIAESLYMVLITTLLKLIQQRYNPINRSSQTLLIIQHVEQSLFMLFNKLVFTPHHYKTFIDKARNTLALKDFIIIGQYFLGSSCDLSLPSVYEAAVLLLLCVIQRNHKNLKIVEKGIRGLPSFIFPNLPVINKRSVYDLIAMMCLFGLVYTRQGTNNYQRFPFNRLLTLRLLNVMVREIKVTNGQMTEYIEELSLQTKIGMAERSFVTEVVKNYVKLIDEKIIYDREKEQQRKKISRMASTINTLSSISTKVISRIKRLPREPPAQQIFTTISRYTCESHQSKILQNYLHSGAQPYSIKYKGKRYTIPYIDVVDQIQKDDKQLQKQLKPLYEKFVYEFILYKKVIYSHNEKYLWNQILPKIIDNGGLQGEDIRESQMSEISQSNSSRINVIGQAPVISLKLSQSQAKNEFSSMSISKNKSSIRNSRCQTQEQGIVNQTTQETKNEYFKPQTMLKQWQSTQSKRKFDDIQNDTPKNNYKSDDQKFHGENSQNKINLPQVDTKEKHYETQQFVIEDLQ